MIDQIAIPVLGMTAMVLVTDHRPRVRRWGPVLGLCAQPFWVYTSYTHQQWGVLAACVIYAFSWARGFYNFWLRPA